MMLVHPEIERKFQFEEGNYQLIFENSRKFYELSKELFNQINGRCGRWVLSEKNEIIDIKNILFIYDYFNLNFNNKRAEKLIDDKVKSQLKQGDYIQELNEINSKIILLNEKLLKNIDFPIEYEEFNDDKFIKVSNYSINTEKSSINNLISFIDINMQISQIKCIVFVNLCAYFEKQEIEKIVKQLKYMDINFLLLDCYDNELKEINKTIIDKDLCEI